MIDILASGEQLAIVLIAFILFSFCCGLSIGSALGKLRPPPYRKENDTPMKKLWTLIAEYFRRIFGKNQQFAVVWAGMTNETNGKLNNGQLQQLALDAVTAVAEAGLSGDEARREALARFRESLAAIGVELAQRIMDSLVQIVYMKFRDGGK